MPKVGLSDLEKRRRTVLACIASKKALNGWDDKKLAVKAHISVPVSYTHLGEEQISFDPAIYEWGNLAEQTSVGVWCIHSHTLGTR